LRMPENNREETIRGCSGPCQTGGNSREASTEMVARIVGESVAVKQAVLEHAELMRAIAATGERIAQALRRGHKVFFFGNGGSAADAQHLAAELVGRFQGEREALPGIALTANTSTMTAISNDYSYEVVFARQLQALGSFGDVAVGISTSGKSPNVLAALRAARGKGMVTVGMTGSRGGALGDLADYCLQVPSDQVPRIQEAHILIGHILCALVEKSLRAAANSTPAAELRSAEESKLSLSPK